MNALKSPSVRFLIVGIAVFGLWRLTGMVNDKLAQIPVKAPPANAAPTPSTDIRRIYPATAVRPSVQVQSGGADVDAVFRGRLAEAEEDQAEPAPDYSAMFQQQIQLQGVASNGAFINDRFYVVGQAMPRLAVARADGSQMIPKLAALGSGQVTIIADGVPTTIHRKSSHKSDQQEP